MTGAPSLRSTVLGLMACGFGSAQAASLSVTVLGGDGRPLPDAVVSVLVKGVRAHAAPGTTAQMAQRERQFQPQLLVIQTGTAVSFPNFDTVRHHVYSFSPVQRFELRLYAGTPATPVVFDKPGVAVLGCNIHDRMQASVVVVDTPHFARTDAAGVATLELPAGEHRLQAWHGQLGETHAPVGQPLSLGAAPARVTIALPEPKAAS